jgi:hypothetical protein
MRLIHVSRFITSLAVPLVIFPLIFFLQVSLGHEVGLFPLYMLPIAKLSWEFGWKGGLTGVVVATGLWFTGSIVSLQPYSYEWLRLWNAAVRGVVFLSMSIFVILFKRVVEQHRRRLESMRALLNVCHGCGSLQGSDGRWIPFAELSRMDHKPRNCECPSCAAAVKKRTG